MTNLADYEQWDYRKIFKIDPCNCEDEECNTFILSVRKTHAIAQYDDCLLYTSPSPRDQ